MQLNHDIATLIIIYQFSFRQTLTHYWFQYHTLWRFLCKLGFFFTCSIVVKNNSSKNTVVRGQFFLTRHHTCIECFDKQNLVTINHLLHLLLTECQTHFNIILYHYAKWFDIRTTSIILCTWDHILMLYFVI